MGKWLSLCLLAVIPSLAVAQELWIEPDKFYFTPGETARVSFMLGSNFIGDPWNAKATSVQRFEHHTDGQEHDLKMLTKEGAQPLEMRLQQDGCHLLVLETTRVFRKMDGETFTSYLREEGLDNIYYQREKMKISGDSATEYAARYSKVILQAGSRLDDTYKKICNLPLEIVPDKNPADMKKGDPIRFTILYQGKPLFGAKVKVWNRYHHRTTVQNIYSQQDGMIETHVSNPGTWMISVVNMIPSRDPNARYRSFWATLVFGVSPL